MQRFLNRSITWVLLFMILTLAAGACRKRTATLRLPPLGPGTAEDRQVAPVVTLTVDPAAIRSGQSVTLTWEARNAETLEIDGGIGSVGLTGLRVVTPRASTIWTATAVGPGGRATATARVMITDEAGAGTGATGLDASAMGIEALFDSAVRDVFFEYDSYQLSPEAVDILYSNATFLRQNYSISILIEGHCDERGTAEYNLALGDRRAKVVKDFLLNIGIESERISTISYGEERPFDPRSVEEAWVKNRRAHFTLARP